MRKERKYDFKKVDVCRNCHGAGQVSELWMKGELSLHDRNDFTIQRADKMVGCPVCKGSGRVVKSTHVEITIEPYTGEPL